MMGSSLRCWGKGGSEQGGEAETVQDGPFWFGQGKDGCTVAPGQMYAHNPGTDQHPPNHGLPMLLTAAGWCCSSNFYLYFGIIPCLN